MSNLSKQYIKNVKTFFPIVCKKEREYLKRLEAHIEDYCEDNHVLSLEDLYESFGSPSKIVTTYYETVSTEYVLKQVKKSHIIKTCLLIVIIASLIAATTYCTISYRAQKIFEQQQIFSEDYIIE